MPEYSSSAGREAIDLAKAVGLELDEWQQFCIHCILAEDPFGKWMCFECGIVVSRQNGKGAILEVRELSGLILFDERLQLHTAHEFKTSQEHFLRMKDHFTNWDFLRKRVKKITEAHGEEGIELRTGQRLRFVARSKRSGRGFSADLLVYDEAMILDDAAVEASTPTLSARHAATPGGPQLIYTGSAGDESSVVFGRVRARGVRGGDPSLFFAEWSADEERYHAATDEERRRMLDDPATWAQGNPGAGIRIPFSHIANERRSWSDEAFARERLSIGRWPDPTAGTSPISEEQWQSLADPQAETREYPVAFSIDMPPDRGSTVIAAAVETVDGRISVEVVARRPGTQWVLPWLKERIETWQPVAVAVPSAAPAATFIADWEQDEDLDPELLLVLNSADMAKACGGFYDAATADEPTLTHRNQAILNQSIKQITKKMTSQGAFVWSRAGLGDISSAYAVTTARYALLARADAEYDLLDSVY